MLCRAGKEMVGQATRVKVASHIQQHTKIRLKHGFPVPSEPSIPGLEKRNATALGYGCASFSHGQGVGRKKLRLHITAPFPVCGSLYLCLQTQSRLKMALTSFPRWSSSSHCQRGLLQGILEQSKTVFSQTCHDTTQSLQRIRILTMPVGESLVSYLLPF